MRFLAALTVFLLAGAVLGQEGHQGRRRRIKKKIVKQQQIPEQTSDRSDRDLSISSRSAVDGQQEAGSGVGEYVGEVAKQLFDAVAEEGVGQVVAEGRPKQPRGFLDEYYASQFESRTEKAQAAQYDMLTAESVMGPRVSPQFYQPTDEGTGERRRGGEEAQLGLLLAKEEQLQALLAREAELTPGQREELLRQLSQWPARQGQALYAGGLSDLTGPMANEVTAKRNVEQKPFGPSSYSKYMSGLLPPSLEESLDRDLSTSYLPPASSYGEQEDSFKTISSDHLTGASKYIGLTGTTSQDIQLGLTFTVPFLSIPLSGINSVLGGGGGGLGDILSSGLGLFSLDTIDVGSLATIAVIAIAAIFVLPQAIYWITGINLSTFNWGRSDDPMGATSGLVALANTVDSALMEFSIDGKGCVARSMCTTLYDKEKKSENMLVKALAGSALKNPNMMTFLGEDRVNRLGEFESITEKYGSKAGTCDAMFRATCPWDTAGMTSIAMKLMASQGTNLADLALKAAAAATNR